MKKRNPALPFIRSLAPASNRPVSKAGSWVGLLNHSLEAPDTPNIARSLANGWFRNPKAGVSVHAVVDRVEAVQTFNFGDTVWGCGTGNDYVIVQTEHVGYAAWSVKQWTTKTMLQCLRNSAKHQAWCWYEFAMIDQGITYYPEWLTVTQVAKRSRSGLLTHNDARLAWGGTTHTDPGKNFPYKILRDMIHEELDLLVGKKPKPAKAKTYTVVKGDTLSGIGQRLSVLWQDLAALNGLKAPYTITIGQKLKVTGKVPAAPADPVAPYTKPPADGEWPLGKGHYFGNIAGPAKSHGGYYASEKKYVKWIQVRLQELGFAPPGTKWADGVYGQPTVRAVAAWQTARHAKTTTRPGEVWQDDWKNLKVDRTYP